MTTETKVAPQTQSPTATIDVFVSDQIETFDLADLDFSNHTASATIQR